MANQANHPAEPHEAPAILESLWRWWSERVAALTPEQLAQPTRCEGWAVRDLVAHATPDPDQLGAALSGTLDAPAAVSDAASVLRTFNAPEGLAESMAPDIAAAAVEKASQVPLSDAARSFARSAELIASVPYDPTVALPYPGVGSLTAGALTDVAIVDATVHGLDLVDAVGGERPPEAARVHTRGVLVQIPDVDAMVDALTGRRSPADVTPVMR